MLRSCLTALLLCLLSSASSAESYKSAQLLPVPGGVSYLVVTDVNLDGFPDLVYLPTGSSVIEVRLSNGLGTFGAPIDSPIPAGSYSGFTAADVNGDSRPDIILTSTGTANASISTLISNGDGSFQSAIVTPIPSNGPATPLLWPKMGVADFNSDGNNDIILSDANNNTLYYLTGSGNGNFTIALTWTDNNNPTDILVGDLNADNKPDFVALGKQADDAVVYLNTGTGTFKPPAVYTGPNTITSIFLADMNNDGFLDLVVTGVNPLPGVGGTVDILLGRVDGTFSSVSSGGSTFAGILPQVLAVADYNQDKVLDIAVASNSGIGLLFGQAVPKLSYKSILEFPAGSAPFTAGSGDFNADGFIDFAAATPAGVAILFGNPDGTLQSANSYDIGNIVNSIAVGDFNGDLFPDLAVGASLYTPSIFLNSQNGLFTPVVATPTLLNLPANIGTTSVGDFNGDSRLDLLTTQEQTYIQFGNGDGTFSAPTLPFSIADSNSTSAAADFNRDGISDIAITSPQSTSFLLNKPALTFTTSTLSTPSFGEGKILFGDLTGNGFPDAVLSDSNGQGVAVFLGTGAGTFTTGTTYLLPTPSQSIGIALFDMDSDGRLDIILPAAPSTPGFYILFGNGDGTFQQPIFYPAPHAVLEIAAGDLDLDGRPDLVLTSDGVVTIVHGTGNRSFGPPSDFLAGAHPSNPQIVDVNNDLAPDLLFANTPAGGASTATVLLNLAITNASITINPVTPGYGQPVLITANFTPTVVGAPLPTGTVNFTLDGTPISVPFLNGIASFTTQGILAIGNHTVFATWAGDSNYGPNNSGTTFSVGAANPLISLTFTPTVAFPGQTVLLTATVASPFGAVVPTGTAQIFAGTTSLTSGTLDATGKLTYSLATTGLTPGTYSYSVTYSGDMFYNPGNSSQSQLKIADFSLSANPTTLDVYTGNGTTVNLAASSSSGFTGTLDLSCTGLPATVSCSFSPPSISLTNSTPASSAVSFLIVSAGAASRNAQYFPNFRNSFFPPNPQSPARLSLAAAFSVLLLVLFALSRARHFSANHRFRRLIFSTSLVLFCLSLLSSCGGSGGVPIQGTPYTVSLVATVHGSNPPASHSTNITIRVGK